MSELTIEAIIGEEEVTFDDGKAMTKYDLRLSNGEQAEAWRPKGSKWPPQVGDKGSLDGKKFKKTPKEDAGGGGFRGGKADPNKDKRIVRQHSQKVAADLGYDPSKDLAKFQDVCDLLCQDVDQYVEQAAPASTMSLEDAQKELLGFAERENIPLSTVANAVRDITGDSKLGESGIAQLDAIKHKAQAFATAASAEDDIPF